MAKRKQNEILEEQKRAREEFLKLKKIQSGEMDAGPKPSEIAIVPKTPREKLNNFWFHYKIHLIAIVLTVIVLSVLITQCASRISYDSEVVYFTYAPVLDQQLHKVADYFEEYATDLNGDGEINVQVINCSVAGDSQNTQYRNVQLQKMQSIMVADEKAMLFITDKDSIEYFKNSSLGINFFIDEPYPLDQLFYEYTESEELGTLPEGLQISCRRFEGTTIERDDDSKASFEEAQKILERIKKK